MINMAVYRTLIGVRFRRLPIKRDLSETSGFDHANVGSTQVKQMISSHQWQHRIISPFLLAAILFYEKHPYHNHYILLQIYNKIYTLETVEAYSNPAFSSSKHNSYSVLMNWLLFVHLYIISISIYKCKDLEQILMHQNTIDQHGCQRIYVRSS